MVRWGKVMPCQGWLNTVGGNLMYVRWLLVLAAVSFPLYVKAEFDNNDCLNQTEETNPAKKFNLIPDNAWVEVPYSTLDAAKFYLGASAYYKMPKGDERFFFSRAGTLKGEGSFYLIKAQYVYPGVRGFNLCERNGVIKIVSLGVGVDYKKRETVLMIKLKSSPKGIVQEFSVVQ
ncbi:hypothetical protein [Leeia aquatica]|uniref:Uncharacterized protein n=1 Tax=Leeia aquatica TaxID=2725557 RepID=A0A847RX48_9NEIS|nr:hypothetical protein [Leeia aquatica]NLR74341.1 hypothetical protein [Leeia aquatica]